MAVDEIRFHDKAFRQLLGPLAVPLVREIATKVHAAALANAPGEEFKLDLGPDNPRRRARSAVVAETFTARLAESRHQALTRALGAGRR